MTSPFFEELEESDLGLVVQRWVIDRTPNVFEDNQLAYVDWKAKLSEGIKVDGRAISIIGSASVGFSLNPFKNFKQFGDDSDIDVAIVSAYHFDTAWRTIREMGPKVHSLNPKQKSSLKDHRERLIYWGTFDTKSLLPKLPFGKQWLEAFEMMTVVDPTKDRDINARIYRDFESLSAYHSDNLRKLRDNLSEEQSQ